MIKGRDCYIGIIISHSIIEVDTSKSKRCEICHLIQINLLTANSLCIKTEDDRPL